jgi:hypothetical protein
MLIDLIVFPDDRETWIAATVGGAEVISNVLMQTRTGWPMRIVITRRGELWTAHAFYAFFEHAAVQSVTARTADALAIDLLADVTPRWTTGVAALSELWDV